MKKLLLCYILLSGLVSHGQMYNNEWIDHSKSYYKFKSATTGLHRISQATISAAGLGSVPAEYFQLWRNGQEVPLFVTVSGGTLSASDYIEFWGEMNDGKPDRALYKNPDYQLNDKWSMETDSATYFLTVNAAGGNKRLTNTPNNVAGTTVPAEPFFMHRVGTYFRDRLNAGWALDVGEYLYTSAYDRGEGWTSNPIDSLGLLTTTHSNLFVYPGGPDATLTYHVTGNSIHSRRIGLRVNDVVIDTLLELHYFNYVKTSFPVPNALLTTNTAKVQFDNMAQSYHDRMLVAKFELEYPRQFNFGGASSFDFRMPAAASERHLAIQGFSFTSAAPVLMDLSNGKRYTADISTPGVLKFLLPSSSVESRLVLVGDQVAITQVSAMQPVTFRNFGAAQNQGDYMIITNRRLYNNTAGNNPIEDYRAYRSSVAGGSYNVHVYFVDELFDQFGYGISKSPLALRNFILYARRTFNPKHVFFIGKGVNYVDQYWNRFHTDIEKLNLVPSFGWPASDALLTADPGSSIPQLSYGRLSVINAKEINSFLEKVKEAEADQANISPVRKDKEWMKNVIHMNGISDVNLKPYIDGYYRNYKRIISDTLFGAKVITFEKKSTDVVEQLTSSSLDNLFREGISLITYFGHSSSNTLEFNLDNPSAYENNGRYPLFIALGCNAGNFFGFNTVRFTADETISEKYVLAPKKGTIGFLASTHFGIPYYLDKWNEVAYEEISNYSYGKTVGEILVNTAKKVLSPNNINDFPATANVEEMGYHGDPAMRVNPHAKPDYVVDGQLVKISPEFVSVSEPFIKVQSKFVNIGKAVSQNIVIEVKRIYPNNTSEVVYRDTIPGVRYMDSVEFTLPIDPLRDKGENILSITIDSENEVDELFETNNTVSKKIIIYEDELKPTYPFNFSVINKQNIKLVATTANAFSSSKSYKMEIDTTELFNSPLKQTQSLTSIGGVLEFSPQLTFTDSTVYYWRVAPIPDTGAYKWNNSSFIYIANSNTGFNQSHNYQFDYSDLKNMTNDQNGTFNFTQKINNLFIRNGVFPTAANFAVDFSVAVNGDNSFIRSVCGISNIIVNVFDPITFKPWLNAERGRPTQYNSDPVCDWNRKYNFQYTITNETGRKNLIAFLDTIPKNFIVVVRNTSGTDPNSNTYSYQWKADTATFGSGNSIYHRLYNEGFQTIDSFNRPRSFIFVYRKGDRVNFTPKYIFSEGVYDKIVLSADANTPNTHATMTSPTFGPALKWESLIWKGASTEAVSTDSVLLDVVGVNRQGQETTLLTGITTAQATVDVSAIDPVQFPYLKLRMAISDSVNLTPYQLDYWRLLYVPAPEGAIAPNIFWQIDDSVDMGQDINVKLAFKNVTETPFDSLKVRMVIKDMNNNSFELPVPRHRPLGPLDTLHVHFTIDSRTFSGMNNLYIDVNPDNDQPEQYHFNNFAYRNVHVRADSLNPLLDVTFDNLHILNNDIVSPSPEILIKLKDEARYGLLDTSSLVSVKVKKLSNGQVRSYAFDNDTLRFTPAQRADDNTAVVHFNPSFAEDGKYELMVSGRDKMGNKTLYDYRVTFEVINKAMISNMLNYPNPFTTSTAFVFTLTGSEVPQELKIQVLTVTGKVVREITKQELGPLRIGRNITEFKWDGTDQYGQRLANGVYLYRVISSSQGKTLEKYTAEQDKTDKYFNKGYGKMYLMR